MIWTTSNSFSYIFVGILLLSFDVYTHSWPAKKGTAIIAVRKQKKNIQMRNGKNVVTNVSFVKQRN
jgi:hypothetical protein